MRADASQSVRLAFGARTPLAVAAAALVGAGCSHGVSSPDDAASPPITIVTITPPNGVMRITGDTIRFTVSINPAVTNAQWTWTSSDSAKVRVDATGLARAVATPAPGIAICARLKTNASVVGCASIVTPAH